MGSPAIFAQGSSIAIHTAVSGETVWSNIDDRASFTGFDGTASETDVTDPVGSRWLRCPFGQESRHPGSMKRKWFCLPDMPASSAVLPTMAAHRAVAIPGASLPI